MLIYRRRWPDDEEEIVAIENNIAGCYYDLGQTDRALRLFEQLFERVRRIYGDSHEETLLAAFNYGDTLICNKECTAAAFFLCEWAPRAVDVRGTQALVSFAPLAFKLFCAARQNAVLRRPSF